MTTILADSWPGWYQCRTGSCSITHSMCDAATSVYVSHSLCLSVIVMTLVLISVSHRILQHRLYLCVTCTYTCDNNNIAQELTGLHRIFHSLYLCVTYVVLCYISIVITFLKNNDKIIPNSWSGDISVRFLTESCSILKSLHFRLWSREDLLCHFGCFYTLWKWPLIEPSPLCSRCISYCE